MIGAVVRGWDPDKLIAGGAPIDEYDGEIAMLAAKIPGIRSIDDAIRAVSEVFSAQFAPERFSVDKCEEAGRKFFAALARAALLEDVGRGDREGTAP